MEKARIFIIGDIHGCLDTLKKLINKIDWRPEKDMLIFLGDYIDRGPKPKGVVDYILELGRSSSHVECLMGNHEAMFLDYLSDRETRLFLVNGGGQTIFSYQKETPQGQSFFVPPDHIAFFNSLKPFIELENYYVVHAGLRPGLEMNKQSIEDMIWIRGAFIDSDYPFKKRVIFGHTPFPEPLIMDNKIGLDTGAVYGNKLTCLELPEMRFHFVKASES